MMTRSQGDLTLNLNHYCLNAVMETAIRAHFVWSDEQKSFETKRMCSSPFDWSLAKLMIIIMIYVLSIFCSN